MKNKIIKAVTFSYDDGVKQDRRLSALFNKYGLKCTFNIPSDSRSPRTNWMNGDLEVSHLNPEDADGVYDGHEIACHTCNHPHLENLEIDKVKDEILRDRVQLEKLYNTKVVGMAYPFGTYDQRAVEVLKENNFLYCRTTVSTHSFDTQKNLLEFNPTCHHNDEKLFELAKQFIEIECDEFKIFYIWGHAYEFDSDENWDYFEDFCKLISGIKGTFYGTNAEVFNMQKQFLAEE